MNNFMNSKSGLTLIELVVIIAIISGAIFAIKGCDSPTVKKTMGYIFPSPPISKDGFGAGLRSLNSPKAHGAPLYSKPDSRSKVVRRLERFESYSVSGNEKNGFTHVKMAKDGAIGWLNFDSIASKGTIWKGTKAFFGPMLNLKTIISIILGVFGSFVFIKICGHNIGGVISNKIDLATVISAAISTIFMQHATRELIPFSLQLARVELGFAMSATVVQSFFPSIIAAAISNHLFGRSYEKLSIFQNVLGISIFFMLYLCWGYGAGWWA